MIAVLDVLQHWGEEKTLKKKKHSVKSVTL